GLPAETLALMGGNPQLRRFQDALEKRNAAREALRQAEWDKAYDQAGYSDPRRWDPHHQERINDASQALGQAHRELQWQRDALASEVRKVEARVDWLASSAGGTQVDAESIARGGADKIQNMY